jgi:LemA protein
MKLSKPMILFAIVAVALLITVVWMVVAYNSLVASEQNVEAQWAQVENQYQRKIDLIPNLVNITSEYTQFEKSVIENVTLYRTQWLSALTDDEKLNASILLDGQVSALVLAYYSAENYPTLSSIPLVASLMDELAGTENRIATERTRYNEEVRDYNTKVKKFPSNLVAGLFGFDAKDYYDPPLA